jgi:hypothetical protein
MNFKTPTPPILLGVKMKNCSLRQIGGSSTSRKYGIVTMVHEMFNSVNRLALHGRIGPIFLRGK